MSRAGGLFYQAIYSDSVETVHFELILYPSNDAASEYWPEPAYSGVRTNPGRYRGDDKRNLEAGTRIGPAQADVEASICVSIQTMGRIFRSRKLNRIS